MEDKSRILIVEDEQNLLDILKMNLEMEGFKVFTAMRGSEALEKLRGNKFDLAILDVMIPDVDGFTVCKTIRLEGNTTPVLFLTAKNTSKDRIEGLKIGGDDYLSKPFHIEELVLRIQKLIQRNKSDGKSTQELQEYSFGGNEINFLSFEIKNFKGNVNKLSKREMMLLKLLILKEGEVVSREDILSTVWGYNVFPSTRTIDNYILVFRKYFENKPKSPKHFHSVRGVGYKFTK